MKYLQTLESYLESGRSPLYHFTSPYSLNSIIEEDVIKPGMNIIDNFHRDKDSKHRTRSYAEPFNRGTIKSISLTRLSSLSSYGSIRLRLDVNKLKNNYKIFQLDEVGAKGVMKKSDGIKKYDKYKKLDIHHNIPNLDTETKNKWEVEFEERIYRKVHDAGKYITHIDMSVKDFNDLKNDLIYYIKKYPHIVVRELEEVERYVGKEKRLVPKEDNNRAKVLLNINTIKELEKEKELVS